MPDSPLNTCSFVQVAGVSWLEKKAAAALFATPPEATYADALACFMKVGSPAIRVRVSVQSMRQSCSLLTNN